MLIGIYRKALVLESDIFLSNFLVGCKGSIETAKRKLDHYYTLRGKGDLFTNREKLDYIDPVCKIDSSIELPNVTDDLCGVILSRLLDDNLTAYEGLPMLRYALLMFELKLRQGGIFGQQLYILDAEGYTISHFLKLPPTSIRAFLSFFQEANPIRVKKILLMSVHPVLAAAINTVVVPFMNKKIKDRFSITSDSLEKVFEHLHLLPSDYEGGTLKSLRELTDDYAVQLKTLESIAHQFQEEVDESKRPQLKNGISDPYFGLHGSIKALVLD